MNQLLLCGAAGAMVLTGCGESANTAPTTVTSVVTETDPATAVPPSKARKAQPGVVAHTENSAGVEEGTWTYRGPGDTPEDRQKARPQPVAEGATVQVLCHEDGRTIPLSQQSPHLGIPETDDWLLLDTPPGEGPEWIPDVYVDTAQPVSEC